MISKSFHFCFQPKVKLCIKIWNVLLHTGDTDSWNSILLFLKLVLLCSPTTSSPILIAAKSWDMIFFVVQHAPRLRYKTKVMTEEIQCVTLVCVYVHIYIKKFLLCYCFNAEGLRYWRASNWLQIYDWFAVFSNSTICKSLSCMSHYSSKNIPSDKSSHLNFSFYAAYRKISDVTQLCHNHFHVVNLWKVTLQKKHLLTHQIYSL